MLGEASRLEQSTADGPIAKWRVIAGVATRH